MEYKAVSIVPAQGKNEDGRHIAQNFEDLIKKYHAEGWEYVRVETLQVWVNPIGGCFGIGQTPGYYASRQMVIFKK